MRTRGIYADNMAAMATNIGQMIDVVDRRINATTLDLTALMKGIREVPDINPILINSTF